jgi:hypothetical protein
VLTSSVFLAFVAVVGGGVTVVRLHAAQLPADQAVALVPRENLVGVGAAAIGIYLVLGLVAVAAAKAINPSGEATTAMRQGLIVLVTVEIGIAIASVPHHIGRKAWLITLAVAIGVVGIALTTWKGDANAKDTAWGRSTRSAAFKRVMKQPLIVPFALGAGAVSFAALLFHVMQHRGSLSASVLVAVALASICFGIAKASKSFWPYGMAVLLSVGLFGATLYATRLYESPQVNPVALLRQGNDGLSGVVGLYIARTDTTYWLASVTYNCKHPEDPERATGRIFSIPRSQVVAEIIGAPTGFDRAKKLAPQLLSELVARQPPGGAPGVNQAPAPAATTPEASLSSTATTAVSSPAPPSASGPTRTAATTASAPEGSQTPLGAGTADRLGGAGTTTTGAAVDPRPGYPAVEPDEGCAMPTIVSLSPAIGTMRDIVRIGGYGFGETPRMVWLDGEELSVEKWTDTVIDFRLPVDARSGRVIVQGTRARNSQPVQLTVADRLGPRAVISRPLAAPGARTWHLDGTQSTPSAAEIVSWEWRVDGRVISRSSTARYTMPMRIRSTSVTLTVTDAAQQSAVAVRQLRRHIKQPVVVPSTHTG